MQQYEIIQHVARNVFKLEALHPWQEIAVQNTLDGFSQIILLPTGYGKSLCFLVPSAILDGLTLIVYPLLALMTDQKRKMDYYGLPAAELRGGQTIEERQQIFAAARSGRIKLLITNPEVLTLPQIQQELSQCRISHIAVDEAHCVCEWGESFRPAYLELGLIIKKLNIPRVTALTATASPAVLRRIKELIFAPANPETEATDSIRIVKGSLDRKNLRYKVVYASAKTQALIKLALTEEKPACVFCSTRSCAEDYARTLQMYFSSLETAHPIPVKFYHAGLSKEERQAVEQWFYNSTDGILCCTNAYGMGVDKQNIRTCIHADSPQKLAFFIQEAGRAGRDKMSATSILIWNRKDRHKSHELTGYALTPTCRRQYLLDYLDGEKTSCSGCDVCSLRAEGKTVPTRAEDGSRIMAWIRHNRRAFSEDEAIQLLKDECNAADRPLLKRNVWEASDVQQALTLLREERLLSTSKKKLDCKRKKLIHLRRRHRHLLHRFRNRCQKLALALERLQRIF
ncbi:MAG: RecQ family ATP-dependent DNA helicase [Treponema sp.]|nr:RecQ family ATP-dependent DNA helicase [Treponema sp.]